MYAGQFMSTECSFYEAMFWKAVLEDRQVQRRKAFDWLQTLRSSLSFLLLGMLV